MNCRACGDRGEIAVPQHDGDGGYLDVVPCPCCRPWADGFGGLTARIAGRTIEVISPAAKGERAIFRGRREARGDNQP